MGSMNTTPKMYQRIKVNKVRCKLCGDVIQSKFTHHSIWCRCGSVGVDGGTSYLKRMWNANAFEEQGITKITQSNIKNPEGIFFDELSTYEEDEDE